MRLTLSAGNRIYTYANPRRCGHAGAAGRTRSAPLQNGSPLRSLYALNLAADIISEYESGTLQVIDTFNVLTPYSNPCMYDTISNFQYNIGKLIQYFTD